MNETLGDNAINRLQLVATLVEREVMRYTPAGVPIVNCLLAYSGQAVEAQTVRQIEFSMEALAAGKIASLRAPSWIAWDSWLASTAAVRHWSFTSPDVTYS